MSVPVGRVSHPDTHGAAWDQYVTREVPVKAPAEQPDALHQIGGHMKAVDRNHLDLIDAVRKARTAGFSWADIGAVLGISRQGAQQRFSAVDEERRAAAEQTPAEQAQSATPATAAEPPKPAAKITPKDMLTLSFEEVVELADQLPGSEVKLRDPYLISLREAIVVTLSTKHGMSHQQIAPIIKKSHQRVSQIFSGYYNRIEREWKAERASW